MAQVLEFKLPDLGEGLTEAEVVRWLVEVGDVVVVDQPVVEVETAKAMVEVPCPYGGVVTARFGEEGTELPVGAPLLTVAVGAGSGGAASGGAVPDGSVPDGSVSGWAPEEPAERALQTAAERAAAERVAEESSGNVLVGYGTAAAPARRRRVRAVRVSAPPAATPAAPTPAAPVPAASSPVASSPVAAAPIAPAPATPASDGPVPVISPLVRKLARENGVDLRSLVGSGPEGLILRADVESVVEAGRAVAQAGTSDDERTRAIEAAVLEDDELIRAGRHEARQSVAAGKEPRKAGPESRHRLTGLRGLVADKMSRSRREIPEATCWVDADATELLAARKAMNDAMTDRDGQKVSLLALLARISVAALARFPALNSSVDMEAREVRQFADIHLGFAAQTPRGLVVPVVRHSQARSTDSINAELIRLTESARAGTLTPGELTGGTFTLNNYGVFGVDGSTPIINHPEAAMLGVGRIVPKPWVHQGELAVRHVVQLSLTFDHRVCDGGTAGGFLRYVADCVEQPAVLLRSV
ncbi:dihydrolipoamide acetyltransferase family protein [Streptomyces sp. Je 1-369]|uniref:dihydrolipoamide acetyltransferase family protein n=1 Tax=Streptomyces sp. Je 1-369 TaxID=2966192 RepID=UPI00228644E2|nr:dihydrolipoamide acetyltransferase family protein [Streptomyces sp. Je 1-369]WAL96678.1 2-oxo acid dehydrogenase subunit E2 [Streptomyces sp. Je 1-369]